MQLSHTAVSIAPADYSSWHDVRTELMSEAKTGFKARVEAELAAAHGESLDELKVAFQQEERAIEHEIDHQVHTFSASVDVSYNVCRLPLAPDPTTHLALRLALRLALHQTTRAHTFSRFHCGSSSRTKRAEEAVGCCMHGSVFLGP